jgi:predicted RNA-binding Zn ribbon-like protein
MTQTTTATPKSVISEAGPDKRAPEPLRLVQQFVNSAEPDEDLDEMTTPEQLHAWLFARDMADEHSDVSDADLRRALDVREGLRAVLFTHNDGERDADAIARLERAAGCAALRASFPPGGDPSLVPARDGVNGALAHLLAIVAEASADGSWRRLKACADGSCRWAFYDHSRNRSGRWCSMATCGNQHKARNFRERSKGVSA